MAGMFLFAVAVFIPPLCLELAMPKLVADVLDAAISWAHDDWR